MDCINWKLNYILKIALICIFVTVSSGETRVCSRVSNTVTSLSSFSSVQSLSHVRLFGPHESQQARPPCPSTTPRVYSNSCPLSQWCHPVFYSSRYIASPHYVWQPQRRNNPKKEIKKLCRKLFCDNKECNAHTFYIINKSQNVYGKWKKQVTGKCLLFISFVRSIQNRWNYR